MNLELESYCMDAEDPPTHDPESLLKTLEIRDALYGLRLSVEEQERVSDADWRWARASADIDDALRTIINLPSYRVLKNKRPEQWWWYPDVLRHAPR